MVRLIKNPFSFLKNRRIATFDFLKLVAMLLVVLDHCLQRWVPNIQETQFYNYIFLTQMPVFMFVAGFFSANKIKKVNSIKQYGLGLIKLLLNLLVPFLSFSIIISIINCKSFELFLANLGQCFIKPQKSLWFLWVLFWIETFFLTSTFLINLVIPSKKWKFFIAIILFGLFLVIPLIIYITCGLFDTKLIIFYSIFFTIGLLTNYIYYNIDFFAFLKKDLVKIISFLVAITLMIIAMCLRPTIIHDDETLINILLRIIGSVGSIFSLAIFSYYLTKLPCFIQISKFGRLSLELYYTHLLLILIPLFNIQFQYEDVLNILIYISLYLLLLITSIASIITIKTFTVTDLIIFGKLESTDK